MDNLDYDTPNLSYEGTVLFMVANFQYLVTCLAFSIAKPFRKPFWTNYPFFFCVIFLIVINSICIFAPSDTVIANIFNLENLNTEYRYQVALGILTNSVFTYLAEWLIVDIFTRSYDTKEKIKKEEKFKYKMA